MTTSSSSPPSPSGESIRPIGCRSTSRGPTPRPATWHATRCSTTGGDAPSSPPAKWELNLGVWRDGVLLGTQGVSTQDFVTTRTGETGSWLGQAHQGQGVGTAMRQAMCAFLFDCLDFAEITSGAFTDNPASLAVSRKVGYQENGRARLERRPGELAVNIGLLLTRDDFVRGEHDLVVEGVEPLRRLIGLDS